MVDLTVKLKLSGGGELTVKPTLGTIIKWEEHSGKSLGELSGDGARLGDIAWIAWEACRHQGLSVPSTYAEFVDGIEHLEPVVDDDPLPETQ